MDTSARLRDDTAALSLGWTAFVYVACWAVVGTAVGGLRLYDLVRSRQAFQHGRNWHSPLSLNLDLLLFLLWFVAIGALVIGVATGVSALVIRRRTGRGVLLLVLLGMGGAVQWLQWGNDVESRPWVRGLDGLLVSAIAGAVAPAVILAVTVVVLGPAVRTRRSTPEPAAGA